MKRTGLFIMILSSVLAFSSCVKNEETIFDDAAVELDAAAWNANSPGVTYPILTRMPAFGRASASANVSDSIITRRQSTPIQLRVNLVGAQRDADLEVNYEVVPGQTTAVANVHYAALPGRVVIPAKSNFGYINIQILNPGPSTGTRDLIIRLTSAVGVTISQNYNTVGLRISQT